MFPFPPPARRGREGQGRLGSLHERDFRSSRRFGCSRSGVPARPGLVPSSVVSVDLKSGLLLSPDQCVRVRIQAAPASSFGRVRPSRLEVKKARGIPSFSLPDGCGHADVGRWPSDSFRGQELEQEAARGVGSSPQTPGVCCFSRGLRVGIRPRRGERWEAGAHPAVALPGRSAQLRRRRPVTVRDVGFSKGKCLARSSDRDARTLGFERDGPGRASPVSSTSG